MPGLERARKETLSRMVIGRKEGLAQLQRGILRGGREAIYEGTREINSLSVSRTVTGFGAFA